jgi:DNA-binding HxlR family transcriptional regulator
LEQDGILERKIYPEIPPRVEYFLTEKGRSLLPIIESLKDWGLVHIFQNEKQLVS